MADERRFIQMTSRVKTNRSPKTPEEEMMSLVGLESVKKEFVRIRAFVQKNDVSGEFKNMVFTGESGVGKSTVAKLLARILHDYGAIESDTYVERNAKELVNNFTGETTNLINALAKEGEGGVILIDDVHHLDILNSSNIPEGMQALTNAMRANPDTVFILCDSKYYMNGILENHKDLFLRQIRFKVDFRDFTREELREILNRKAAEKGYKVMKRAMDKLLDVIFLSKTYGNNINASAALAILEDVIIIQNVRTELIDDKTINLDDVTVYMKENDIAFIDQKTGGQSDARKKLGELVGLKEIKDTVDDLIAYFSINRGKKVDFHMAFSGNPGTGKTEVARIIGKLMRQEGILPTSKFLEVTRRDLIGQYVGQSAIMTRDVINRAMGGVLYIDEAYSLAYGGEKDFGPEVIAELLKAMEDRRGEFCVVLAGYTSEMQKLFDINPGLYSRIKFNLEFPDYTDEEFYQIAKLFLRKENAFMSEDSIRLLVRIVALERLKPNFANVRTLREYLSRIQIKHARRIMNKKVEGNPSELTYEDILNTFGQKTIDEANGNVEEETAKDRPDPKALKKLYAGEDVAPFALRKETLGEAILALRTTGDHNGESTGFTITKDGYFLTCAHCVAGAEKIQARRRIVHHGKNIDLYYEATPILVDEKADVALCKIQSEDEEFEHLTLSLSTKDVNPLDKVLILGYPFGSSRFDAMSVNEGRVASYQRSTGRWPDQINLDIEAKGGNSGSPILVEGTSRVIGVFCGSSISHGSSLTEEINYCRPIEYAWKLLEEKE